MTVVLLVVFKDNFNQAVWYINENLVIRRNYKPSVKGIRILVFKGFLTNLIFTEKSYNYVIMYI